MPLAYGKKHYKFQELVEKIMRKRGWSRKRASRYVGGIQKVQEK